MTQTGTGQTFTITADVNTIVRSAGNFTTDGFTIGQKISIIASSSNTGTYTIQEIKTTSNTDDTIVTNENLSTETIASSYAVIVSSETVLFNNQYIQSRIENADSNSLQHFVFLNLKSRKIASSGTGPDAFETNRIGLKITNYSVSTSRMLPSFPIPAIGVVTGESETIGIDLGMATKTINLTGTIVGQRIIKKFEDVEGTEPKDVSVMMTASEIAQLIHSYVDSSSLQSQQKLNELVVLMPSRVDHQWQYHSGLAERSDDSTLTPEEYLPMIPFSWRTRNQDNKGTIYGLITDHSFEEFSPIHSQSDIAGLSGFVRSFNTTHTAGMPNIDFTIDFEVARIF